MLSREHLLFLFPHSYSFKSKYREKYNLVIEACIKQSHQPGDFGRRESKFSRRINKSELEKTYLIIEKPLKTTLDFCGLFALPKSQWIHTQDGNVYR
jgi:hypothetical protein